MTHTVSVGGEFRHDIVIGDGLLATVATRLAVLGVAPRARVLLVVDANVAAHADRVAAGLVAAGHPVERVTLRATEAEKSIAAVETVWQAALAARMSRRDVLVVIGGGLVGDVGGFAAASFLRGVRFVAIPTTLLAMVDASTGGKTGVNLPLPGGDLGKNMAGAFWPPLEVIADPSTLTTLPRRELASGMAECVKHAFIDGEEHVRWLETHVDRILHRDPGGTSVPVDGAAFAELVARSVAVKARIVTEDPREQGIRAVLNFGHTFGHGLETLPGIDLTHGEAVAIGMVAACTAGEAAKGLAPEVSARLRSLLQRVGLPVRLPERGARVVSVADVVRRMGFDKKVEGGQVRFVIPSRIGEIDPKTELAPRVVQAALVAIGCASGTGA